MKDFDKQLQLKAKELQEQTSKYEQQEVSMSLAPCKTNHAFSIRKRKRTLKTSYTVTN